MQYYFSGTKRYVFGAFLAEPRSFVSAFARVPARAAHDGGGSSSRSTVTGISFCLWSLSLDSLSLCLYFKPYPQPGGEMRLVTGQHLLEEALRLLLRLMSAASPPQRRSWEWSCAWLTAGSIPLGPSIRPRGCSGWLRPHVQNHRTVGVGRDLERLSSLAVFTSRVLLSACHRI